MSRSTSSTLSPATLTPGSSGASVPYPVSPCSMMTA
jgi:hypothetical protein